MEKVSQQSIIDAAARLINETGSIDISLSKIAAQLGITHGALYKHFNNKQSLWEAVANDWFQRTIMVRVNDGALPRNQSGSVAQLHDWLWRFVAAKNEAYQNNPQMFKLNTQYIDNNPYALQRVLAPAYAQIDEMMSYHDTKFERAETILSAFSVFTLPNFSETWQAPDFQSRFEAMWRLIERGIKRE